MEKAADFLTASIAARARRRFPHDVAARAAFFNTAADRAAQRFWRAESVLARSAYTVR
jgi:hypothetical protein